jgi:UDP-N-acetylglucosamine 2-epimerase
MSIVQTSVSIQWKHENKALDIVIIAGNRPEIIKVSELIKLLNDKYESVFLYTGQHYSPNMRDVFLKDLDVKFDYDLASNTSDVSTLTENIQKFLINIHPKYVIVYGDTNSTLAGALASTNTDCKLIHIEAGIRNFNQSFIEERNRVKIDSISDYLLAPTELSKVFLKYEDLGDRAYVTGNLIVDVCRKIASTLDTLPKSNLPSEYILLTVHKPAIVEDQDMLKKLSKLLAKIKYKIVFPAHPRTISSMARNDITLPPNVKVVEALGYRDFLGLLKNCLLVMTDSGGVQEESVLLKKPCITLFSTTDRQETILIKANRLFFPLDLAQSISEVIEEMIGTRITINPYGKNVTKRAIETIDNIMNNNLP